jgi:hypothetical protein
MHDPCFEPLDVPPLDRSPLVEDSGWDRIQTIFPFLLYCDDLSFEADEHGYKALKVVLDGSVAAASENCLVYATSNRRHLMPEFMNENLEYQHVGEEIHPGETSEEKVSLSERFGLWVSFHSFDQDEYLSIVRVWLGTSRCRA